MITIERKYKHRTSCDIQTTLNNKEHYNFHIVYYINCLVHENYFEWIKKHMAMIKNMNGTVYIIATINHNNEDSFKKKCVSLFPNVTVECNYTNQFEYPGIMKIWELGQQHSSRNDILLYFHSKGITHEKKFSTWSSGFWNNILNKKDLIEEIFDIFPTIDKIGPRSGGNGWIWYNFWYARGSYIKELEKPVLTQRRHYYESWLGTTLFVQGDYSNEERPVSYFKNTIKSCYSLCNQEPPNIGYYYKPDKNVIISID
jgi:hypothetical protein